jgi:hypothetical protein
MKIANPIYDVVFKYLMEDNEIAKMVLSTILNVEIVSLETKPQEIATTTASGLRLFRIDFKATIRLADGTLKVVLIEIQKSKKKHVVSRFRRYVAKNYASLEDIITLEGEIEKIDLPITAIYFLGYRLKNVKIPVLNVKREYYNAITGKKLKIKEDFVEQLSHDLYAIQIPRLKMVAQHELEKILDIFSQHKYITADNKVLEYTGDTSNPKVELMLKRLNMALLDERILEAMYAEEEVENEILSQNVKIEKLSQQLEEERKAKEEERKAKEEERKAKEEERKAWEIERQEFLQKIALLTVKSDNLPK